MESGWGVWGVGSGELGLARLAVCLLTSTVVIHDLWYKNAVIYCLNVETFLDSKRGWHRGLRRPDRPAAVPGRSRDHLHLATPFYVSPNKDDGYDVSDYYGVHPRTGTFGEFVEFMNQARQLGLKVIVDLVVNHRPISIRGSRRRGAIPTRPTATTTCGRSGVRGTGITGWYFRACSRRRGRAIPSRASITCIASTTFSLT